MAAGIYRDNNSLKVEYGGRTFESAEAFFDYYRPYKSQLLKIKKEILSKKLRLEFWVKNTKIDDDFVEASAIESIFNKYLND